MNSIATILPAYNEELTRFATGAKPLYYSLYKGAVDFGYTSLLIALDGGLREAKAILHGVPHIEARE